MTEQIKHCPQPDPPELVMRADGYHYRTEDEMRELTDEQIDAIAGVSDYFEGRSAIRAAIAADRALNAPADRDVMRQALEEIALAGMSSSPEMSPYYVQSWHASRAWEFIGIAARALAAAPSPPADQSEAQQPLPRDSLYAAGKRASASGAKLRCRKCGDNYELTFNYAALRGDGVGQEGPAEQQREQEPVAWMTPGGDVTRSKVFAGEQSALSFGQQRPTPLYTHPSPPLAELRAKVEALAGTAGTDLLYRRDVLALLGDKP